MMLMKVIVILMMISMMKFVIAGILFFTINENDFFLYEYSFFSSQLIFNDTIDYSHRNISSIDTNELFTLVKDPNRIKNFQLNSNILLTIPSQIEQFQSLITIELSNNQLVQLPYEISLLKNLKNLFLKNNSLDDLSLPKQLEQLKQLEVINLGGNRLKQFPYQLFQMFNLKEVYLGSNQITFLPDLFQTLIK
jgi:Leucine-rich repeat (LRR) protein